jgi:hypothetical protein
VVFSQFEIMKKLSLLLSIFALPLSATPIIYEGFSVDSTETARQGWATGWHPLHGEVGISAESIGIAGLPAEAGALLLTKKGEAIAKLDQNLKGTYYGAYRFSAEELKSDSLLALSFGSVQPEELTPKTAALSFVAKGWRRERGLVLVNGKAAKIEAGVPIEAKVAYQVLFKVGNAGTKRQVEMWILNAAQVGYFSQKELSAVALNAAPLGKEASSVLQRVSVSPVGGSRLHLTKDDFAVCSAKFNPKTAFDEIRISTQSLADALGEWSEPVAAAPIQRKAAKRGAPNILFITMDDMNWDSMGAYGCEIPGLTPNMDQLAEEGLRFEYAYNATSSCVPSRTTYMTWTLPAYQRGFEFL